MKEHFIKWIRAAGVRALKTVAQTAIATVGTTALVTEVNWSVVAGASALAGLLSLLTSVAGLPEVTYEATGEMSEASGEATSEVTRDE